MRINAALVFASLWAVAIGEVLEVKSGILDISR
jgi:hypothetical protein